MANPEHLTILKRGVEVWDRWRKEHTKIHVDLKDGDLQKTNLRKANLEGAAVKWEKNAVAGYLSFRNIIFLIAVGLFLSGIRLSFLDLTGSAVATYGAALGCLTFVFLSQFKKFKALGVEAELLGKRIEEATVLISHLRGLVQPIAELLFSMVARGGRIGSRLSNKDSYRIIEKVKAELRSLGLTEQKITDAQRDWHHFNMIDLTSPVYKDIRAVLLKKQEAQGKVLSTFGTVSSENQQRYTAEAEKSGDMSNEQQRLLGVFNLPDMRQANQYMQNLVRESKILSGSEKLDVLERNKEHFEDLEYYAKHMEFRRIDVWFEDDEA